MTQDIAKSLEKIADQLEIIAGKDFVIQASTDMSATNDILSQAVAELTETQYGLKYIYNCFALPISDPLGIGGAISHAIYIAWPKNLTVGRAYLQNSVFQKYTDDPIAATRQSITLIEVLYATLSKPLSGAYASALNKWGMVSNFGSGGNDLGEKLDTLINRFSLAFLETGNSVSIVGKIRDTLVTGLLFGPGLSLLSVINTTLDVIYGVLRVDLGWIARSTEEIAAKDCCSGNGNGSTTVTNPDGSTTTTPNPPIYPPVPPDNPTYDPDNPDTWTTKPYLPVITKATNNNQDGYCGLINYTAQELADFLEGMYSVIGVVKFIMTGTGITAAIEFVINTGMTAGKINLVKVGKYDLRQWLTAALNLFDVFNLVIETLRSFGEAQACEVNGFPPNFSQSTVIKAITDWFVEQGMSQVNQDLSVLISGYMSYMIGEIVDLAPYAQYCPCPSQGCLDCGNPSQSWLTSTFTSPQASVFTLQAKPATGAEVQYYDLTIGLAGIGTKDCVKSASIDYSNNTTAPAWNGSGWGSGGIAAMNVEPSVTNTMTIVSWSVGATSVNLKVGIYRRSTDGSKHLRLSILQLGTCQ